MTAWTRRALLRGALGGTTVAVGLPFLEAFVGRGARAAVTAHPLRFGTWSWGCGVNPDRWFPAVTGSDAPFPVELAALTPWRHRLTVLSGFDAKLDGRPNFPHHSGVSALRSGVAPDADHTIPAASLDVLIAGAVGGSTPFRSLDLSATGRRSDTYSWVQAGVANPSDVSPLALYERVFGLAPSGGTGAPDPGLVLRQGVLSAVADDVKRLESRLGSHDRQRLDLYLTSVRQLERQLQLLAEPPDLAACQPTPPGEPDDTGTTLEQAVVTHKALVDVLVMALACDRTRVFNLVFSWGISELRLAGSNISQHQLTHDEPIDGALGYQPEATRFVLAAMDALAYAVERLASVPEGEGTLLDHCILLAHSETSLAKTHDITSLPMLVAGGGNGGLRQGQHLAGNGAPVSRVGLTLLQAMGLPVERWGQGALQTDRPVSDLLA